MSQKEAMYSQLNMQCAMQAMLIDVAGGLTTLNEKGVNSISASVTWLGTEEED